MFVFFQQKLPFELYIPGNILTKKSNTGPHFLYLIHLQLSKTKEVPSALGPKTCKPLDKFFFNNDTQFLY